MRDEIEAKIKSLDLDKSVILLGARGDVPCIMQAMDVFVFPSLWEGLPVTVVEAQAAGLSCIVSETVTKDVKITNLVEYLPLDKEIWINQLSNLNGNRTDVIQEIRKTDFDIEKNISMIEKFYTKII